MLFNISKNQPPKSSRRGDIMISPFLTLKEGSCSLLSPPSRARKLKCDSVHSFDGLDVPFEGSEFSAPLHHQTAPKSGFLVGF